MTLFGYWEVEAESDIDAAREAHRIEAEAVLYELAAEFSKAGAPTDIQLDFGRPADEEREFRNRVVEETHADAIFVPNPFTSLGRVLAPIRDARNQQQLIEVVAALNEQTVIDIELFHVCEDESMVSEAREMLDGVHEQLTRQGFPELEVKTTVTVSDDPAYAISQRARSHDLIVMGETSKPDYEDQIFGPAYEYVAGRSEDPILVVRESDT
ncbi:MAG: universal stress protein [Salinirussus sp.]